MTEADEGHQPGDTITLEERQEAPKPNVRPVLPDFLAVALDRGNKGLAESMPAPTELRDASEVRQYIDNLPEEAKADIKASVETYGLDQFDLIHTIELWREADNAVTALRGQLRRRDLANPFADSSRFMQGKLAQQRTRVRENILNRETPPGAADSPEAQRRNQLNSMLSLSEGDFGRVVAQWIVHLQMNTIAERGAEEDAAAAQEAMYRAERRTRMATANETHGGALGRIINLPASWYEIRSVINGNQEKAGFDAVVENYRQSELYQTQAKALEAVLGSETDAKETLDTVFAASFVDQYILPNVPGIEKMDREQLLEDLSLVLSNQDARKDMDQYVQDAVYLREYEPEPRQQTAEAPQKEKMSLFRRIGNIGRRGQRQSTSTTAGSQPKAPIPTQRQGE